MAEKVQGGELGRRKGNFGGGRVELTKELNWEKNRTEPKIEVLRIEETPTRERGKGGRGEGGFVEGKLCRKGGIVNAQFSGSARLSTIAHWHNTWRGSIRLV